MENTGKFSVRNNACAAVQQDKMTRSATF